MKLTRRPTHEDSHNRPLVTEVFSHLRSSPTKQMAAVCWAVSNQGNDHVSRLAQTTRLLKPCEWENIHDNAHRQAA
jgi:hypothetical protein